MKTPKVSIIIPVLAINNYIKESVPKILEVDWPNLEIIILPNKINEKYSWPKTRQIATIKPDPAIKRDIGFKNATGEILAFLDDDAYPEKDWLTKAISHFNDKKIAGVGGPAITPEDDGILQKVSGAVFESYLGGGATRNRYLPIGKVTETEDWPTVNLLVRKDVFEKVGGFDNTYWPGEDTKLCLDILNAGYKIKYDPEAIVYHHRRSDLWKHFKQVGNYALHRGHFAKIYPQTSRKIFYFVPTLFVLYLIFLLIYKSNEITKLQIFVFTPLIVYCLFLIVDAAIISTRWRNPLIGLLTMPMIFLTHVWYGIRFVWGLSVKKLDR